MKFSAVLLSLSFGLTALFSGCRSSKLTPEQVATQFFEEIKKGDYATAYGATSFKFQMQQTQDVFAAKLLSLRLNQLGSVSWQRGKATEEDVKLRGDVKLGDGTEIPVALSLHRQQRQWRISDLATNGRGAQGEAVSFSIFGQSATFPLAAAGNVPGNAEAQALARQTIVSFAASLEKADFTDFYQTLALVWQQQSSQARFQDSLQKFVRDKIHLEGAETGAIKFSEPPRLDDRRLLMLRGTCVTHPKELHFVFHYVYEVTTWRLFSINCSVDDEAPAAEAETKP